MFTKKLLGVRRLIAITLLALPCTCVVKGQSPLFQLLPNKETNIKCSDDLNETENLKVLAYKYLYNGGGVAIGDIHQDGQQGYFLRRKYEGQQTVP